MEEEKYDPDYFEGVTEMMDVDREEKGIRWVHLVMDYLASCPDQMPPETEVLKWINPYTGNFLEDEYDLDR
ncbi:hypothetical protein [uncultured Dialister sp.]|jgi:hypothetical protein|uniref:hypothetical protein n=1 Tax=uncultured Dialister sp. TaxID=278064 RepID=UPI0025E6508B|nr:hypothetical protein [uncultured Dialister sp.]